MDELLIGGIALVVLYELGKQGSFGTVGQSVSSSVDDLGALVQSGDFIPVWADAIQNFEGGHPGDRNMRNNNPGNLRVRGDLGSDANGFGVFSTYAKGRAALEADLRAKVNKYPDYSLLQIMTRYLGGDPNNPQVTDQGNPFAYAQSIADSVGASIDDTLGSLNA